MSIVNRRNAIVGWVTWLAAKSLLKHKAKSAVPGTVEGSKRPNKGAIAAGVAALGGLVWFMRRKGSSDEPQEPGES